MLKQKYGRIINISSVIGIRGNAGQCNYAASKAGVIGLTKSLAKELAARNINVNAIAPGFIKTDMTEKLDDRYKDKITEMIPSKKLGTVTDVAKAALYLAAEDSDYITGSVIKIDGGMAI
jgi:3-oxoacyl-[acyl-carrier protein] reductase